MSEVVNCLDVIKPFIDELDRQKIDDVQIIGGVYSAALSDKRTVIDVRNKLVVAHKDLVLSTRRGNGSLRDLDALVKTADETKISSVQTIMEQAIGNQLDPSVFGYNRAEILHEQIARPFGRSALLTFVGDRYTSSGESGSNTDMVKALFPFMVPIDPESLETWYLQAKGCLIPVPHPDMSLINYTSRSIGGVRPKDSEKLSKMAGVILDKKRTPELIDWAVDGPGRSQVLLGRLISAMTPLKRHPDYFGFGKTHPSVLWPENCEKYFMIPGLSTTEKIAIISFAISKANASATVESCGPAVAFFQKYIERTKFNEAILKNKVKANPVKERV